MQRIRIATLEDIPLVRELTFLVWPQTYRNILTEAQVEYMLDMMYSPASLKKQMEEGCRFIIVYQNEEPVGFASSQMINETTGKLHKIYVVPAAQGTGAGKLLLQDVYEFIKSKGGMALQLQVNRHNNARYFYEKEGFSVIEEADFDIGNGYYMNDYVMEKKF